MRALLAIVGSVIADVLDRFGVITREQLHATMTLAWPRIITGFAIQSKRTADLAMVGIAVGPAGTAGLAFAFAYGVIVRRVGLGLASGTISLVSQNYGGEATERASLVVKQSVLMALGVATLVIVVFVGFAEPLIGLFGADQAAVEQGSAYLIYFAPAAGFEILNLIASRTYTGVGDTYTEMLARGGGAVLNVVLSAVFIFGAGLGIIGAAIGTSLGTGFVTIVLAWGMTGRRYGFLGMQPSPVPITREGPWLDWEISRHLIEISLPEIGRQFAQALIVFPLLWIAATFGPAVVTAFEVARRLRAQISSINWGLSLSSSSLVGQRLGADEEAAAGAYGAAIIRLSVVLYLAVVAVVILLAEPLAGLFVTAPEAVGPTAVFIVIGAISAIGNGIDGTAIGALIGAGDTRLPFLASLVGRYAFALPVAALGLITPLGVAGLYLGLLLETYVPGAINYWLFRSGRWKAISRRYRDTAQSQ